MANLSITTKCNRACSYCFAESVMKDTVSDTFMSRENFLQSLDFLERSGIKWVRLLGGEPTLHPDFVWLVDQTQIRGMHLLIFSNGLMPAASLNRLEQLSCKTVSVIVNVNQPEEQNSVETRKQAETLRRLGNRAVIGFNIHKPDLCMSFLLDMIHEFGLTKAIRIGLAHPCIGGNNSYLHPKQYREVGYRLASFLKTAHSEDVILDFDCGFVQCMFPKETLKFLRNQNIGQRCNPTLDILPDKQVISCYPLFSIGRESLPENHDDKWLRNRFRERLKPYQSMGIFRYCILCPSKRAQKCLGGCLAASMLRIRHSSFVIKCPELESRTI